MLAVQNYIKEHGLDALCNNFAINAKRHSKYNNLVLLKYSQLESPLSNPVVQECRGIILDEADDWKVVCYNYKKFFNYSEPNAAKIDFSKSKIYEKVDGSLMQLYYYNGEWNVATSGTPDASGDVGDFGFTFAELFWGVWNELGYSLPKDTNNCYAFELTTQYNLIVVQHQKSDITLHGGRNLETMKELNPVVEAHTNNWKCVKIFPFDSMDALLEVTNSLNGIEQEGFVVVDSSEGEYKRVKLKCENYVRLAHLKESCTTSKRQMLEIIRKNESDEFLSYFPQFTDMYYDIKLKLEHLIGKIEGFYEAVKDIEDRKTFALKVKDWKYSGAVFAMRFHEGTSVRGFLQDMQIKNLEEWLDVKSAK